jgi:hypothetical protein
MPIDTIRIDALGAAGLIFAAVAASGIHEVPDCRLIEASMGYLSGGHA